MISDKELYKFISQIVNRCVNIESSLSSIDVDKDLIDLDLNKKINPKKLLSYARAKGLIEYTFLYNKLQIRITEKCKIYLNDYKINKINKKINNIKYIIATLLTLATLVVSIISLVIK
jgi:GH35 family endo-1,4-beta-xylanase